MPTKRTALRRARRKRKAAGLATRPTMMSKTVATKRFHGVDTRVFWFKTNGRLTSLPAAQTPQFKSFKVTDLIGSPPQSLTALRHLYDQYKILGFKIKFFPANVGIEGAQLNTALGQFRRGNHCIWIDQRVDTPVIQPQDIGDIIGTASARIINPRRPYAAALWRPKGKPAWGSCKSPVTGGDLWNGAIYYFIQDSTVTPPNGIASVFSYYTVQWKVIFRGRNED